jgi:hypothetical protein
MRRVFNFGVIGLLAGCGPSGIVSTGDDSTSGSEAGDGDPGDGDPGDGDGDGDPGDGDGDPGDGDPDDETETGPPPPDLPAQECQPVIDGSVELDEFSTQASFDLLSCVTQITGDLDIKKTTAADLSFLSSLQHVGGTLYISGNGNLTDLTGLDALEHVGATIRVSYNSSLVDLTGLGSLHEFNELAVNGNAALTSVAGLGGAIHLHAVGLEDHVRIAFIANSALTSLDGLAGITSLTVELPLYLVIKDNYQLGGDMFGLAGWIADEHELSLALTNNALASLEGLEALTTATVIDLLGPGSNFTSLAGLDNLQTVTQMLRIGECICINPEVDSHCQTPFGLDLIESLDGLSSLAEVGLLTIWGNAVLNNIDALANLAIVEELSITENPALPAEAVASLLAGIEVTGSATTHENGGGQDPHCGFIPQ